MTHEVPQNPGNAEPIKEPKFVQMPDHEAIMRKLQDIKALGISPETNSFYGRFAKSLSEREVVGAGLYVAWELAQADTMAQYPPVVRSAVNMSFDRVIDAITPDPEVAEDAKEFRKKVLAETARQAKAAEPKLETLGPEDSLDDFDRFSQAVRVREILRQYTERRSQKPESLQDDNNPYYKQTHRGFFLEDYYGTPLWLHTPWGEFRLRGAGEDFRGDKGEFRKRLDVTAHKPRVDNQMGTFGPIYAVHKIDDVELPDPVERPRSAFKPCEEVNEAWDTLARQYYESKGQTPPPTVVERFALDDEILKARGQSELPINENDIKNLEQLDQFRGQVVKYTQDGGKTWRYTRLDYRDPDYFSNGSFGYRADEEVLPNTQVHSSHALTDERFSNGLVVRPATPGEIHGRKFSYDFNNEE